MVVVVGGSIVVGAAVVGAVVGATDLDEGTVVVASIVLVVAGPEVDVVDADADVDDVEITPVVPGPITNGSTAFGRPAMARPAAPPTTITTRANGHGLRIRSVKLQVSWKLNPAEFGGGLPQRSKLAVCRFEYAVLPAESETASR